MKRLSKMINGRSGSSKTRHFNHLQSSAEQAEAEKMTTQKLKFASLHEEDDDDDDDDEAAHRVRQNPKKIGKVSSGKNVVNNHQQKFVCNKCGKAFQSSKAMCGHMACHSEKEKPSSKAVAKKKVLMDSESDAESGAVEMRRRSRRAKYCKKDDYVADSKAAKFDEVTKYCSSEASGIEQEQEEVAICLMMLSRDSANWGGLNSIGDSSDNNSVVLEDRSISTRLGNKDGLSSGYDLNEANENLRKRIESFSDFDTGYARNIVVRNVETGVKIRRFRMNKLEEGLVSEPHLSLKKLKSLMDGDGCNQIQRHRMESYPWKGALNGSYSADLCNRVEQKALICPRSSQAYDVNVACNKQFTAGSPYESSQNRVVADAYHSKRKGKGILDDNLGNAAGDEWKREKYETMACFKNRRVHLAEECENNKYEVSANLKGNGIPHGFIDLNLPAPVEDEEANEPMGISHRDMQVAFSGS